MKKINMGCGWRDFGDTWIHIDGGNYDHLDYNSITDLSQFPDDTIDLIYASHVVEYFDRDEVLPLLKEWKRILKPGAILRVAVPNFELLASLYLENKISLSEILGPLYGKMAMGNDKIYHKTTYDYVSLEKVLKDSGYGDIKMYDWREVEHGNHDDHSQAYIPHMDKENGTLISLNVECVK